ncbi:hypothetical protein C8J56DRAFT_511182 [Mycena floridula]|nr:hypothetical protein C8J56DRAFT_511182 [Mycena floridula]
MEDGMFDYECMGASSRRSRDPGLITDRPTGDIFAVPVLVANQKDRALCCGFHSETTIQHVRFRNRELSILLMKGKGNNSFAKRLQRARKQEAVLQRIVGAVERRMANRLDSKAQTKPPRVFTWMSSCWSSSSAIPNPEYRSFDFATAIPWSSHQNHDAAFCSIRTDQDAKMTWSFCRFIPLSFPTNALLSLSQLSS